MTEIRTAAKPQRITGVKLVIHTKDPIRYKYIRVTRQGHTIWWKTPKNDEIPLEDFYFKVMFHIIIDGNKAFKCPRVYVYYEYNNKPQKTIYFQEYDNLKDSIKAAEDYYELLVRTEGLELYPTKIKD